eukprot:162466_1
MNEFVSATDLTYSDRLDLKTNYTFKLSESPYYVKWSIRFNEKSNVIIENGVEIIFTNNYHLTFAGDLNCGCTITNSNRGLVDTNTFVHIHKHEALARSNFLSFGSGDGKTIKFCNTKFQHLMNAFRFSFGPANSDVVVNNCEFTDLEGVVYNIYSSQSNVGITYILDSTITNVDRVQYQAGRAIYDNVDISTYTEFCNMDCNGIAVRNSRLSTTAEKCMILESIEGNPKKAFYNNIVSDCDYGIEIPNSAEIDRIYITDSTFTNIGITGINLESGGTFDKWTVSSVTIRNNLFINNHANYMINGYINVGHGMVLHNNEFIDNNCSHGLIMLGAPYTSYMFMKENSFINNTITFSINEWTKSKYYQPMIYIYGDKYDLYADGNSFISNTVTRDYLIQLKANDILWEHNLFSGNQLAGYPLIYHDEVRNVVMEHNLISDGHIKIASVNLLNTIIQYNDFYGSSYLSINYYGNANISCNNFYDADSKTTLIEGSVNINAEGNYYNITDINEISSKLSTTTFMPILTDEVDIDYINISCPYQSDGESIITLPTTTVSPTTTESPTTTKEPTTTSITTTATIQDLTFSALTSISVEVTKYQKTATDVSTTHTSMIDETIAVSTGDAKLFAPFIIMYAISMCVFFVIL